MQTLKGIGVSPGISIARAVVLRGEELRVRRKNIPRTRVEEEVQRLELAVETAANEIEVDIAGLSEELQIARQVLATHRDMVRDSGLRKQVIERIRTKFHSAEYAVSSVVREYLERFKKIESPYIAERVHDLSEIERKLLRQLLGKPDEAASAALLDELTIVIAHDLSPSQTARLDKKHVCGFAIDVGGRTSHTAIMARAMQIPAVVALRDVLRSVVGGELLVVDGHAGMVIIDPDEATLAHYQGRSEFSRGFYTSLEDEISWPAETIDGYDVRLSANIELPDEISTAVAWGAHGIGLYRTEFLYETGRPNEKTHWKTYRRALNELEGRELVIRTLDAGADKFHAESVGDPEPNPFLGCRSIRLCLEDRDLFRDQIRAVLRVARLGPVKMMLPMVSTMDEIYQSKSFIDEVRSELIEEGVEIAPRVPLGIMVEVPSIALLADRAAKEVDFFSIGTNDLVQYCLAVDRINERVAHLYQPTHPAILRLIDTVIRAGRDAGIPVSICGEMCSDPAHTVLLLGLGLRSFSVSPISIPTVKRIIRQISMREAREIAVECLRCERAEESQAILDERVGALLPDFG